MSKMPLSPARVLISAVLVAVLYWGLNQAESRSIYADWDKWLHASVFFVIWWLGRWSLRIGSLWIALLVIAAGGAEEIHQLWEEGHVPDLYDWYADIAGVTLALSIYLVGRLLWLLHASIAEREASAPRELDGRAAVTHPVDWRWTLRVWRWDFYFVVLAGNNRRELSPREHEIARLGMAILIFVFLLVSTVTGVLVLYLIKSALGLDLVPGVTFGMPGWLRGVMLR